MPDIFDEVQEELRAERARRLATRWGGLFGVVALAALLGVGGWQGWQWWQARQANQAAAIFLEVSRATEAENADLKAAGDRFAALADTAPHGYRVLARLRAAALRAETGDGVAALALWDAVASDGAADPLYRDLASLMWSLHGLDSQDPGLLASRLAPLAAEGNPWRASARELQALVAVRRGEREAAKRSLQALAADVTAPQGVRDRAARLAAGLDG
ncbi:tetratricopeptide repeat protein [Roseomonas sp. OT10]|uniref:tetratricopeptide repeat protein n=1 Tax=Roseomonas cutis TaxID=2897332 RepID=UPI001E63D851|nr:tetratricopeptide repeat protein [Roseomonas sp. OT10]UFN47056.1 tetratricopeptide repeat protein [Roseomonas sp. OT10]